MTRKDHVRDIRRDVPVTVCHAVSKPSGQPMWAAAGAGDCFTAPCMVGVLEGRTIPEAMQFAAAEPSICVSRPGAITSLPTRKELDELLSSLG